MLTTLVLDDNVLVECRNRKKIGHLQSKNHGVKGTVYILNKDQLLIQQFTFIGKGSSINDAHCDASMTLAFLLVQQSCRHILFRPNYLTV